MKKIGIVLSVMLFGACVSPKPTLVDVQFYSPHKDDGDIEVELIEPELELEPEIQYAVIPREGFETERGYIRLSFKPASDREVSGVQGPGLLTIHIGHKDIEGANTKWYTYNLVIDGKEYVKKGKNSVPFVRGRHDYWWNEEVWHLPKPLGREGVLTIYNDYAKSEYRFRIRKEVVPP